MKVGIGRAASELGVSRDTLRRWEAAGRITAERTPSGHRRYDLTQLRSLVPHKSRSDRITIAYARVSHSSRKKDLKEQINRLQAFCTDRGWDKANPMFCETSRDSINQSLRPCSRALRRLSRSISSKNTFKNRGPSLWWRTACGVIKQCGQAVIHLGVLPVVSNASGARIFVWTGAKSSVRMD